MNDSKRVRDQVYSAWRARPDAMRRASHTEAFVDEMWSTGHRMNMSPYIHYEKVMNIIRSAEEIPK